MTQIRTWCSSSIKAPGKASLMKACKELVVLLIVPSLCVEISWRLGREMCDMGCSNLNPLHHHTFTLKSDRPVQKKATQIMGYAHAKNVSDRCINWVWHVQKKCVNISCFILVEDQPLGIHNIMYWNTLKMSLCIAGLGSETRYKQCMKCMGRYFTILIYYSKNWIVRAVVKLKSDQIACVHGWSSWNHFCCSSVNILNIRVTAKCC